MSAVRRADPADAGQLARLRWRFRADFDPAVEEGRVVGHVWVEAVEKVPNPVDEAELHSYLTNMYVLPEVRGRGIGTRRRRRGPEPRRRDDD